MATARPFIFISYAHENARIVSSTVNRLNAMGYNIWYDREIGIGSAWTDELAKAITDCAVFIVFISVESAISLFVRSEIEFALRERKTIVPIYLDPIDKLPPGLALGLNSIQGVVGSSSAAIADKLGAWFKQNKIPKASPDRAKRIRRRVLAASVLLIAALAGLTYAAARFRPNIEPYLQIAAKKSAPAGAIALDKERYAPAEPLAIKADKAAQKQTTGGAIALVARAGAPDDEIIASKESKNASGKIILRAPGLEGEYEARLYAKNSGSLIAIKRFVVSGTAFGGCKVGANKRSYTAREKIVVKIGGVKKDAIDSRMTVGLWRVWEGGDNAIEKKIVAKQNASLSFFAPSAIGRYEIRVYNNADILAGATLMAKTSISVRSLSE
ncbi:MAG: toll/interleukin-1 receptor domain-containing protein [Helicobacteraceae bacterium]|jgi:hypothetical protein|nr:toll/interleukin-1 receptor domain-containing protein [Helicobacteraceae bacterium]